ncbi:MAG: thioredoxin domain-containing protein [bacterium]
MATQEKKASEGSLNNITLGLLVIVFIVVIVLIFTLKSGGASGFNDTNSPARGKLDSTVVVREYADYLCPACGVAAAYVEQLLYPKYKDQVKFIFKDFPLIGVHGEPARIAALTARCAQKQDKFWEMNVALFSQQKTWEPLKTEKELVDKFKVYGDAIGLDSTKLEACVADRDTKALVDADMQEGDGMKINSTPSFYVNSTLVVGYRDLENTIRKELGLPAITPEAQQPTNGTTAPVISTVPAKQ